LAVAYVCGEHEPGLANVRQEDAIESIASMVGDFLRGLRPAAGVPDWRGAVELLLQEIDALLNERDSLLAELQRVYADRDIARARVDELQALYNGLHVEAFRLRDHAKVAVVASLAGAAVGVAGSLGAVLLDHNLAEKAAAIEHNGDIVIDLCTAADDPATWPLSPGGPPPWPS